MAFSDGWMSELIARSDIVSVISAYTELKPKGRRLWGLCPLHGEKTASFSVSPDKQLFYCFGCHAGGTVIQFIMAVERLTFPEAVKLLADKAGMEMPEEADDGRLRRERAYRERLREACRQAARFYMETLLGPEGEPGRKYLAARGLGADEVKRFGIGFAPDAWDTLTQYLAGEGYTQQELLDAGLITQNANSGRTYDAFRNRVIFPIQTSTGSVIGFGARVLNDDKPKYINTGDTPIYNKRNHLYGLNLQKGAALSDIIMVEGYMDVIGLYQAGVTNAVASLGTALTAQQSRLLKRYTSTAYIAYDGDAAGQNAMIRGMELLRAEGLSVRVIVFPDEQDPDEYVRAHGKEAFDKLKEEALSLNAFKLESLAREFDLANENEREAYAKRACRMIAGMQPIERDRYYQLVAKKTGYTTEALRAQTDASRPEENGALYRTGAAWKNKLSMEHSEENERTRAETALLYHISYSAEAAKAAEAAGADTLLSCDAFRSFYGAVCGAYARGVAPNAAAVIAAMEEKDAARMSGVLKEDEPPQDPTRAATDCIRRIRRYDMRAKIDEITASLGDPQLEKDEKQQRLNEIQRLNKEMRGLR